MRTIATMPCMAARPRRVLVGYDGSESAGRALDAAAGLIGYGSTLAVASVAPTGESAEAVLEEARERLLERHVAASYVLRHGDTADQLVEAALMLDADLIVVGGGPRTATYPVSAGLAATSWSRRRATYSWSGSRLDQTLVERVADELRTAREPELLHDVCPVCLRRTDGDVEHLRDLLVRVTERQ